MNKKLPVALFVCSLLFWANLNAQDSKEKLLGMYIHQHWSYNHPYASRTWTYEDWRDYVGGLKQLGYNFILIWPVLETMPDPLTPSDEANLAKIASVIDMAHAEFKMKVSIVLCPNVSPKSEEGRKYTFEQRPFFHTDDRVDPGDAVAFGKLMAWREKLFAPLAKADGLFIIDSDPGGYPNSTNLEFVYILDAHRRMLDRLRPGIQIDYWALHGWESYSRFYATGEFRSAPTSELRNAISLLFKQPVEPWGIASGRGADLADSLNMSNRVLAFPYSAVEAEPSFPFTLFKIPEEDTHNSTESPSHPTFYHNRAYEAGKNGGQRGVLGNAQTHIVQLPNTFALARGAQGLSLTKEDYITFANDLIPGHGATIVEGWDALQGKDTRRMRAVVKQLSAILKKPVTGGPLKGLYFGNAESYVDDLIKQLQMAASLYTLSETFNSSNPGKAAIKKNLAAFTSAAEAWQQKHQYANSWHWPAMDETLRKLNAAPVNKVLDTHKFTSDEGATPFEKVKKGLALMESYTPRLIASLKEALAEM